jgi:hypothetical protein
MTATNPPPSLLAARRRRSRFAPRTACAPALAVAGLLLAGVAGGCLEDLEATDDGGVTADESAGDSGEPGARRVEGDKATHVIDPDGATETRVDATDQEQWVQLDLATLAEPASDAGTDWLLSFRRFNVRVNGGVSGTRGVDVAILDGGEFAELELADAEGLTYTSDLPDGDDEDGEDDLAFREWYDYTLETHTLSPKDRVYLVRDPAGPVYALQFTGYYNEVGTSGHPRFRWRELGVLP